MEPARTAIPPGFGLPAAQRRAGAGRLLASQTTMSICMTTLSVSQAGTYDFAARFSSDGGSTWTYGDRNAGPGSDGSEDGYQSVNAGALTVTP